MLVGCILATYTGYVYWKNYRENYESQVFAQRKNSLCLEPANYFEHGDWHDRRGDYAKLIYSRPFLYHALSKSRAIEF
jgi:hypothetical protein